VELPVDHPALHMEYTALERSSPSIPSKEHVEEPMVEIVGFDGEGEMDGIHYIDT
jgi:hypothetical protein